MGGAPYASQGVPCARSRRARVRLRVRFLRGLCAHLPRGHHMPVLYSPSGWFHFPFPVVLPREHSGTAVSLVGPRLRSQPSAASLPRKFQSLLSPPPPLWHPAYADSSASRQTAARPTLTRARQLTLCLFFLLAPTLSNKQNELSENDDGVVLDYFNGEKLGDDALLWETMAPFIKDGGFIEVHGEDAYWRWKFNDGQFQEVELRLVEVNT